MKRTCFYFLSLFIACAVYPLLHSCGDDDAHEKFTPVLPVDGGNVVRSISHQGGAILAYDWNLVYADNRLVSARGTVRNGADALDKNYVYDSRLYYGSDAVEIENSGNEQVTTELNSAGHIERMVINQRDTYEFYYRNGRISEWIRTEYSDHFGYANQYVTRAIVEYDDDDLLMITMVGPDKVPVVCRFVPSALRNLNGLLPVGASQYLGCLGMEHLFYAGLLGKPTSHLVASISVTYPQEYQDQNYQMAFDYHVESNNTVLCTYKTPQGETAAVNYGY